MRIEILKEIADIIAGQSPPSETYNKSGEGVPFFQGMADYGEKFPVIRNWCNHPTKISLPNDILISVRAPVGPVNINNIEACIGRGLSAIRAKKNYSYEYIYYFLKANEKQIGKLGVGSTFTAITQKDLGNIKITLPDSYAEQVKIATVLSKAEALIKQRKENIDLLDEFLKSAFLKMFGDPMRNEKRWEKQAISNYTDSIVPGRDKPKSFTGSIPWFTTTNLVDKGFIKKTQDTFGLTESEINEVRAKIIPVGSIIMTCVGDLGILSINREPCIVNQQLHTYQCDENTNSIYLMFCLSFMKSYMYKMASTTTVPYMNKTICNSIPVIHPPIELQNQFSEIFEKAEAIKEQFKRSLKDLENLYGSLRQRAFKGELDLSKLDISDWENFDGGETEQDPVKRSEIQKYFDEAEKKIKSGALNYLEQPHGDPFDIDEAAAKKQGAQFYKEWKKLNPKKKKSKLTWDRVSTEQVANWIKENYTGYHFTSEMLIRFLMDEHVTFPDYYSTEELKKNPKANDADDLKTLIFSSLNNENPFLKLEQVFYNAELDNINLTLRDEDFNLIKTRAKQERTGVYLQIAK